MPDADRRQRKRRQALLVLAKIAISVSLLTYVASLIDFQDHVLTRSGEHQGRLVLAEGTPPGGLPPGPVRLALADGSTLTIPVGELAAASEDGPAVKWGILSYVGRIPLSCLALAATFMLASFLLISVRLHLLLRAAGARIGLARTTVSVFVGSFFNNILPGQLGGDLAKAWVLLEGSTTKPAVVTMILFDRVMGLWGILTLGVVVASCATSEPTVRQAAVLLWGVYGCSLAAFLLYVTPPMRRLVRLDRLLRRLPFGDILARMDLALVTLWQHKVALVAALGLSLATHLVSAAVWVTLGRGMGVTAPLATLVVNILLVSIVAILPISFGGWGISETTARALLQRIDIVPEVAVAMSVLRNLTYVLISLPGGVLLVLYRRWLQPLPEDAS